MATSNVGEKRINVGDRAMKLTNKEKFFLEQFEDNEWMTRDQIDPLRIFGNKLRHLQQMSFIVSRQVHDFKKDYALTNKGLAFFNLPPT